MRRKLHRLIAGLLPAALLLVGLYGCGHPAAVQGGSAAPPPQMAQESDAQRLKQEYEACNGVVREDGVYLWPVEIPEENPFTYITPEDAIDLAEHGTGVLFIGSGSCRVCRMLVTLLTDAAADAQGENNPYVQQIYYLNPETIDRNAPAYPAFCEKVLTPLARYMRDYEESYTNIYGTEKLMEAKSRIEKTDDVSKYKYTVSFYYDGKLLGMNIGTTSHFVDSDTPPTAEDSAEFTKSFWKLAGLFGSDLCNYC